MPDDFKVGDRIDCYHPDLVDTVRGRKATVTAIHHGRYGVSALVDGIKNPTNEGFNFNVDHIRLDYPPVTDEEIAQVFGLKKAEREPQYVYTLFNEGRFVALIKYDDDAPKIAETFFEDFFGEQISWERSGTDWVGAYNEEAYKKTSIYLNRERVEGS